MASVDKVKVGSTSYDISPSKDGTLTGFTSNDAASPTDWTAVDVVTASDTNSTIFSKVTTMVKNIRWLYSKLGTTDFSATGQSTVTGALSSLKTDLDGKAASSHSHTTAQLPVSSSQTNSNSYIPTSALVYSMQQQITSLNDAYDKIMNGEIELNSGISNINGNFIAVLMNVTNTTTTAWQPICKGFYDKSYFTCNGSSVTCVKACNVKIYFSSGSIIGNNDVKGYLSINGTTKANIGGGYIHVNTYNLNAGDIVQAFNRMETTGRSSVIGTLAIELT